MTHKSTPKLQLFNYNLSIEDPTLPSRKPHFPCDDEITKKFKEKSRERNKAREFYTDRERESQEHQHEQRECFLIYFFGNGGG